jgi:hypothetical protein
MPRIRTSFWFFLVLVVLTAAAVLIPYLYNLGRLLKPEQVREAAERWRQHGPADYELIWREKVEEGGEEVSLAVYEVKVRDGQVVEVRLGGERLNLAPLSAERKESFTVPGLLRRIERELDEDLRGGKRRNYLTAYFDTKTGCPFRYVRRDREKGARVEWTIKLNPPGERGAAGPPGS